MTNFAKLSMNMLPTLRTWVCLMTDWIVSYLRHSAFDGMIDEECVLMTPQH